jgi:hypothetical protein
MGKSNRHQMYTKMVAFWRLKDNGKVSNISSIRIVGLVSGCRRLSGLAQSCRHSFASVALSLADATIFVKFTGFGSHFKKKSLKFSLDCDAIVFLKGGMLVLRGSLFNLHVRVLRK